MNFKYALALLLVGAVIGAIVTKRLTPVPVSASESTTKEVVVTHKKEIVKPDGTKETDTIIVDNSSSHSDSRAMAPKWHIDLGAGVGIYPREPIFYVLGVDHSFIGNLSLGAFGSTRGDIGVRVGYSF